MDNMISFHLKMALLHKPTALRVISLEWMDLYSAKKKKPNKQQEQTKSYMRFQPKKMPVWSCVSVWEQGKSIYIVLSGSPLRSCMALAKRVERKQKGGAFAAAAAAGLRLACLWWSGRLFCPLSSFPAPLNPSEQRAPMVMHIQRYCTPLTDDWDTSDAGYVIYRRHWLDVIACTR